MKLAFDYLLFHRECVACLESIRPNVGKVLPIPKVHDLCGITSVVMGVEIL